VIVKDCFIVATKPDSPCKVVINSTDINVGITDAAKPSNWNSAIKETCQGFGFENDTDSGKKDFQSCVDCLETTSDCLYEDWPLLIAGLLLLALSLFSCFFCCCCSSPEEGYGGNTKI
jgi:hypothetical protein